MDTTELQNQAIEIRDAENEGENTATKVGTLLVNIIQVLAGTVTDESLTETLEAVEEVLQRDYASLENGTVKWHQRGVIMLKSMGSALDNIDGGSYTPTFEIGDTWFSQTSGGLKHRTQDGDEAWSVRPDAVYINSHTLRVYKWASGSMVELGSGKNPVMIDYMVSKTLDSIAVGEVFWQSSNNKLVIKTGESSVRMFSPDPSVIYCARDTKSLMFWDTTTSTWQSVGGGSSSGLTKVISNIELVNSKVNTLINALANIAFKQLPKPEMTELDWGENTPSLTFPQNGDEVNVGTIPSDGTSVTKTITIKGKNLESAVNLAVSGTGFSLSANSVSAAEANAGTTVIITYTDNGTGDGLDKTGTLTISSAGSEFTQRTVTLKAKKLAPGVVEPVVSLASNDYLELTGSLSGETYSGVLSVKSASASTKGLPWPEDISALMNGASKTITYDDSTGAITISGVTADVTITAVASVVDGVDYQNNPIRWKEGLYFNGNGSYNNQGDNTSTDANWCISDFVKCDWNNLSIGNLMFGTGVAGITEHYIIFYDENKQYLERLSLNTAYRLYDLSNDTGIVYFRTSMLINKRSTRIIRDLTNERFLLKGSDYDGRYDNLLYGIAHIAPSNTPTDYQSDSHAVTQALPVNFGPGGTITFWCGSLQNINGSYPYLFFYSQGSVDSQYQTAKLSCNAKPRSWENSSSDTHLYASITLFLESIDDCYCKVTRNGVDTFYFAGFNVNTNGNA